jgi:hypothetical protein
MPTWKKKTPDTIDPKAEARAPRPRMRDTELPQGQPQKALSPLQVYLDATGIKKTQFVKASGIDFATVQSLCEVGNLPNLITAFWIEVVTKGRVCPEMWLGTILARERWHKFLDNCNPEVRKQIEALQRGGYAHELMKDPRGRAPKSLPPAARDAQRRKAEAEHDRVVEEMINNMNKEQGNEPSDD